MTCRIALHRAPGLIGSLIRWQNRSEYSHASLVFDDIVIESHEFSGVRAIPGLAPRPGEVVHMFNVQGLTGAAVDLALNFATEQVGKPYDWPMVFGFVSRSRYEGQHEKGKWFCSELVFAAVQAAGIELLGRTYAWEVSPGMLGRSPLLSLESQILSSHEN